MNQAPAPVVIGVDGTSGSAAALRFGLQEARRLGTSARLVHVAPNYVPATPTMPVTAPSLHEVGLTILRRAEVQAEEIAADVPREGRLALGARAVELAKAAQDAALLVVGRDDRPMLERLVRGNTSTGAAARATVPVISVPNSWEPSDDPTVVVGIRSVEDDDGLLRVALGVARDRGARLVVLHAWSLPTEYDDIVWGRTSEQPWTERLTREIEERVAHWRDEAPDVPVEVRVVHAHPVVSLAEASMHADELVLARRSHALPATHLGGTGRSVLRMSHCPVRVVSAPRQPATAAEPSQPEPAAR